MKLKKKKKKKRLEKEKDRELKTKQGGGRAVLPPAKPAAQRARRAKKAEIPRRAKKNADTLDQTDGGMGRQKTQTRRGRKRWKQSLSYRKTAAKNKNTTTEEEEWDVRTNLWKEPARSSLDARGRDHPKEGRGEVLPLEREGAQRNRLDGKALGSVAKRRKRRPLRAAKDEHLPSSRKREEAQNTRRAQKRSGVSSRSRSDQVRINLSVCRGESRKGDQRGSLQSAKGKECLHQSNAGKREANRTRGGDLTRRALPRWKGKEPAAQATLQTGGAAAGEGSG